MSESKKCSASADGKFIEPCAALAASAEYGNPRGKQKGIFEWKYFNADGAATRSFFGVKSGEKVSSGIAFNFCPFCGEAIGSPFTEKVSDSGSEAVAG